VVGDDAIIGAVPFAFDSRMFVRWRSPEVYDYYGSGNLTVTV
jgi:hypothetical protein